VESDALVIQSEQKPMRQAEELIVMVDPASPSAQLILSAENVSTIITDDKIPTRRPPWSPMPVSLITVKPLASAEKEDTTSVA
jgi:DeoR family ulaG and ulaABCDEF operon transcriptional repressor